MFRIRFLKDMTFEVVVTNSDEGSFSVVTEQREVNQGRMLQAIEVIQDDDGFLSVHFTETERAVLRQEDVELSTWEPEKYQPSRHCCNHG